MRVELQPGFVLHSRPFRDSSLILDCFTRDYGRLSLVAKGARSAKSRQRQLCQPFMALLLSWQGKSNLKTLIQLESCELPLRLTGNHLFSGFYLNELLIRLLPEQDSCPEIFDRYRQTLQSLAQQEDLEPVLRKFEFGLLEELGYRINLYRDADGIELDAQQNYRWQPEHGWLALSGEMGAAQGCRDGFPGEALLAMAMEDYRAAETRRVAKQLSRMMYQPLLGNRPLESRKLFQK